MIKRENDELVVKNYPEIKQPPIHQPKTNPPNCPSCKRSKWMEFDKGYYCTNREKIINQQKHQIDKKVHGQGHYFSTRLLFADKKIREI